MHDMVAVVAHELKNPLSAILASAAVLGRLNAVAQDDLARAQLQIIQAAAAQMRRLLGDLYAPSSVGSGRLVLEPRVEDAGDLVEQAVALCEPQAALKSVRLVSCLPGRTCPVRCDRARVLQVLMNLLGNAIKFANPETTITIRLDGADGQVHFAVSDVGPGIAVEDLPRLFQPYFQAADRVGAAALPGSGLGLFIARNIVEAHGGSIWAESQLGSGSTFHFTLPAADGSMAPRRPRRARARAIDGQRLAASPK
jgi:signal transduction histidine kinase